MRMWSSVSNLKLTTKASGAHSLRSTPSILGTCKPGTGNFSPVCLAGCPLSSAESYSTQRFSDPAMQIQGSGFLV